MTSSLLNDLDRLRDELDSPEATADLTRIGHQAFTALEQFLSKHNVALPEEGLARLVKVMLALELAGDMAMKFAPANPRPPAEEGDEKPGFYTSPPMFCPCSDPKCTESCVEIGCRQHPNARLRAFVYRDGVGLMCSKCSDTIAAVGSDIRKCANRAQNPSNIN